MSSEWSRLGSGRRSFSEWRRGADRYCDARPHVARREWRVGLRRSLSARCQSDRMHLGCRRDLWPFVSAVVAAVSVSGPTTRINDHGITRLGELLVGELRGLSAQLGHNLGKEAV
jgi:hypothetical protein